MADGCCCLDVLKHRLRMCSRDVLQFELGRLRLQVKKERVEYVVMMDNLLVHERP